MPNPLGRKPKYAHNLHILEDEEVYSPAMVTSIMLDQGLVKIKEDEDPKKVRIRIRHALAKRAVQFEKEDGIVKQHRQGIANAYFGWRWKSSYLKRD